MATVFVGFLPVSGFPLRDIVLKIGFSFVLQSFPPTQQLIHKKKFLSKTLRRQNKKRKKNVKIKNGNKLQKF